MELLPQLKKGFECKVFMVDRMVRMGKVLILSTLGMILARAMFDSGELSCVHNVPVRQLRS